MRARRIPLAVALVALAACSAPDGGSPVVPETGPRADALPPPWLGTCATVVRFNPPPVGAVFGAPIPNPPGIPVFTEGGVGVSPEWFDPGAGPVYNWARIEPAPANPFGDGKVARMANLSFRYTPPATATFYEVVFEFMDLGGVENVSVNGQPLYIGDIGLLPNPYFAWSTNVAAVAIAGGKEGTVRIWGKTPIKDVVIGGQEFWVDNVCFR